MNKPVRLYLPETDDPRDLPLTPWMGHTGREQKATLSPSLVVLRAVHHWHVIDSVSLQAVTGYTRATIRWATEKLIESRQVERIGYLKGIGAHVNPIHLVPYRNGPKRPSLPFFHPVRTGYIRPADEADRPGASGLIKIGNVSIRFHTIMVPKVVAWILGEQGLQHRTVPLPEYVLRKEFGWHSEKSGEDADKGDSRAGPTRRLVRTSIPDAYLVAHRFAIRVEFEFQRKSFERYEEIFSQIHPGDIVFFVIYQSNSLYTAIRNFVEERALPVCPIRWGNQADLDAALLRVETMRADSTWLPSRYRSAIVALYAPATLDPVLHDARPEEFNPVFPE